MDCAERAVRDPCEGAVSVGASVTGDVATTFTAPRLTGACVCANAGAATQRIAKAREIFATLALSRYLLDFIV